LDSIKFPVIQQENTVQVARPREIPTFAIEEAITNAVAHRNFNTTSSVQVMVFLDRVEIWNAGTLPDTLKIEDLKKLYASHPPNPTLASVLYLADYIQQVGSGTTEMVRQCKKYGLPEPEFVSVRNREFRTILPRDIYTDADFQQAGLNKRQRRAVKLVKKKGEIALADLKENFADVGERTLRRDLQALVEKGILKAHGTKKGRKYGFFKITDIYRRMP